MTPESYTGTFFFIYLNDKPFTCFPDEREVPFIIRKTDKAHPSGGAPYSACDFSVRGQNHQSCDAGFDK